MTLDEAVATLRTIAAHPVDGTDWVRGTEILTADFHVSGGARHAGGTQHDALSAALHNLEQAASIVCAVVEFSLAREAVERPKEKR